MNLESVFFYKVKGEYTLARGTFETEQQFLDVLKYRGKTVEWYQVNGGDRILVTSPVIND